MNTPLTDEQIVKIANEVWQLEDSIEAESKYEVGDAEAIAFARALLSSQPASAPVLTPDPVPDALQYMKHTPLCAISGGYESDCTCGRDEAAAALSASASDKRDAERLDWLESMANEPDGILLHDGSKKTGRLGLGLTALGRTLRQAIDAAIKDKP